MSKLIVHVSEIDISRETGMGRVEFYWKEAFEKANHTFLHIGPRETGPYRHPYLFPIKAYNYYKKLNVTPSAFIIHEPAAGIFANKKVPCYLESHGVERRYWEALLQNKIPGGERIGVKTKVLFPLWRLRGCDKGLKKSDKLLLINKEDCDYVQERYDREKFDIFVFKNGVNLADTSSECVINQKLTLLFNATWIERKGIRTLVKAAEILYQQNIEIDYLLIGTHLQPSDVLIDWPSYLLTSVQVVSRFSASDEISFLKKCDVFVLPSFFEGQPLSLLQAMAAGKCCIATNCCGQKDIITHNLDGLLFEAGDAMMLAELIKSCSENRMMVSDLGKAAKANIKNRTWENGANELMEFVLSTL